MIGLLCMAAVLLQTGPNAPSGSPSQDSVSVRLIDVELRNAVQALAPFLDRPVAYGSLVGARVTLESPGKVPRSSILGMLRSLLDGYNYELVSDSSGTYRVRLRDARQGPRSPAESRRSAVPELFVIRLQHARASEVAATVSALYNRGGAPGDVGDRPSAPPEMPPTPMNAAGGGPVIGGRIASLVGDVTIVPDTKTNALLVRASRSDYELIEAAVGELDLRPLQVLIEVNIAEVRRDRSVQFGIGAETTAEVPLRNGATASGAWEGNSLGDVVLRVMRIGGGDVTATLRASASKGDAIILSRPVVVAANNERAVITVGTQRPFVQVSRSLPTNTPQRDQVVQYKDVGTTLTVRPTVSANNYVTLDVTQEVSSATTETQFDAPIISTRSIQTKLLIRDSQTVILGGLTDNQRQVRSGGLPILSSIPWIGGLFGRSARSGTTSELFVFITPRILRTDEDFERATQQRRGSGS
jgi:general secretion pathway protein D